MKCLICGIEYEKRVSLCNHIRSIHKLSKQDYYDKYIKIENEGICKYEGCSNPTIFLDIENGYKECCCLEHTNLFRYGCKSNLNLAETKVKAQKNSHTKEAVEKQRKTNLERYGSSAPMGNKTIQEKYKRTCIEKYGADNPFRSEKIKVKCSQIKEEKYGDPNFNNREKARQTNIEKYGTAIPQQLEQVKKKTADTCLERYGSTSYLGTEEFRTRSKKTCKEKYGVETYVLSDDFRAKFRQTSQLKYHTDNPWSSHEIIEQRIKSRLDIIAKYEQENDCIVINKIIDEYGQGWLTIKDKLDLVKIGKFVGVRTSDLQKIIDYTNSHTRSHPEDEIIAFIKSISDVSIIHDDRTLIKPYELDIYIPDKKLAIEFNGNYWHSFNVGYDSYAHLNKTELCSLHDTRLVHIQEWEWNNKKDICNSIISSALGVYTSHIYARKCEVKTVSSKDTKEFLEANHIQGSVNSTYRLGLYYNNELVQLICIGKSRFKKDEYELLRMCTKLNTQVIGGFSKLMKYQPYDELISYVDISKFNGSSYMNTNWTYVSSSGPSYAYYKGNVKLNRVAAQKHKLGELLGTDYNPNETEVQNMIRCGWLQVYDCGTLKVKWSR